MGCWPSGRWSTPSAALGLAVHPASVQDRDGAVPLLQAPRRSFPFIERAFADAAYAARRVADATRIAIEIVRKPSEQVGFAVHPRRWVVERCSPGSAEIDVSPKTSRPPSPPLPPLSMPPQPCCSSGVSLVAHKFRDSL
jgi:hypothetical protein